MSATGELAANLVRLAEKATPGERQLNGAGQLLIEDSPAIFELPRTTKHYGPDHWFIAACSPENIRLLATVLSDQEAEIERLRSLVDSAVPLLE